MGSFCVVVLPPILNDDPCFAQIESHLSAQTFIAESAVKAFDLVVLPWATWVDIDRLDRMILQALLDFSRYKFGTIITTDIIGYPILGHRLFQNG